MGLDMYLEVRKQISKLDYSKFDRQNDEWPPPNNAEYDHLLGFAPEGLTKYSDFGGAYISYTVGYWRKANAIHGWFIRECANGVDECQPIYVPREKLVELRNACDEVLRVPANVGNRLENTADEQGLLPTQGFFFGGYELDEWYMNDLEHTTEIIDHVLSLIPEGNWDWSFIYQASW
jgi:hypothetical protein